MQQVKDLAAQAQATGSPYEVEFRLKRAYAEALREADRRKDEFLATLAHELRNPLAPIRNALQELLSRRNWGATSAPSPRPPSTTVQMQRRPICTVNTGSSRNHQEMP